MIHHCIISVPSNIKYIFLAVLHGPGIESQHCVLESIEGNVTLHPIADECFINGTKIKKVTRLSQGNIESNTNTEYTNIRNVLYSGAVKLPATTKMCRIKML